MVTQKQFYLSADEIFADEVDHISETDNIEKHPASMSMTKNPPELIFSRQNFSSNFHEKHQLNFDLVHFEY